MTALVAALAFGLERVFGYPIVLQKLFGHPVEWIGRLIGLLDEKLNRRDDAPERRRLAGVFALLILLAATGLAAGLATALCRVLPFGFLAEAVLGSAFLASRQLGQAVRDVAAGLRASLQQGQAALQPIVGRDAGRLDASGVARAAIETLSENTSDGVIAPLLYFALFGLPGLVLYKAINTADSMLGHLTERHRAFGWASARLDDAVNFVPARLTALLIAAAARLRGYDAPAAWRTARRDAPLQDSPNSGWPEAAMAGALGLRLGGPRAYDGEIADLPYMGTGRVDATPEDIARALAVYRSVNDIALALVAGIAVTAMLWGVAF
jgi:adenosylcobinamide-phosphate synthase